MSDDDLKKLKVKALAWLGRQEYSIAKFKRKLIDIEATEEQIEAIVAEFTGQNWLSEQRYCEGFVRGRVSKGQGKIRIINDGRGHGLDEETLKQALTDNQTDWFEQARLTYYKRFGDTPYKDIKEKAKRLRFMQYRGFTMEQVNYAMTPDKDY